MAVHGPHPEEPLKAASRRRLQGAPETPSPSRRTCGPPQDEGYQCYLCELENDRIDCEAIAFLGVNFGNRAVALGAQHVFHLHRLDDAERLAGLDLLALDNVDRFHETGHRAEQLLARIGLL